MDADPRPEDLGEDGPTPEDANPYAEEDDTGTLLTHSEMVAYALESLADHHMEYLARARGAADDPRARVAAVDFWTGLRRTIAIEVEGRPRLAPGAWIDALGLYLAFVLAGAEAPAPTA